MPLLDLEQFHKLAREVSGWPSGRFIGWDLETNGVQVRRGARAFIMGFAFRELDGTRCSHSVLTDDPRVNEIIRLFLSNNKIKYLSHNSKFEASFARHQFKTEVLGDVWDTMVMARVQHNTHMSYSLQACAQRIGLSKYQPMLDWLKANKRAGKLHHDAPLELVIPYVEQDAWLEVPLYENQKETFIGWQNNSAIPIWPKVELEMQTTKSLFEIEDAGIKVNTEYCRQALSHERARISSASAEFTRLSGVNFVDSRKTLTPLFDQLGIAYARTEKGNASFTAEALKDSSAHPVVAALLRHRSACKRASSYWENFLDLEHNGYIYPSIQQTGAKSFRMSIRDPSAQNWTDDSEDPTCVYPIRKAIICDEDEILVSLDYSQMELRLMADEAGDHKMAEAFRTGTDFHQEVAVAAGVPRSLAKNGRFAKLYGAGVKRVAETLGVSLQVSQRICDTLERASPEITRYTRGLIRSAECSKMGWNWLGGRYSFDRGLAYKYPNYRIQGGCSEILKIAIRDILPIVPRGSLFLPVHDELCFRLKKDSLHVLPEIKRLMIAAHRNKNILDMDVSCAIGYDLHNLQEHPI